MRSALYGMKLRNQSRATADTGYSNLCAQTKQSAIFAKIRNEGQTKVYVLLFSLRLTISSLRAMS